MVTILEETGLKNNTVIILTGDHGDMLGERGLWYKMTFFEWAARVPLIIAAPGRFRPGRAAQPVSHLDLFPTLMDCAAGKGGAAAALELPEALPGRSLMPLLVGETESTPRQVQGEYLGESAAGPLVMLRRGDHKYMVGEGSPPQLFDLAKDPLERDNLAGSPAEAERETAFAAEVAAKWDFPRLTQAVIASQRRRRFVSRALGRGRPRPWDFQPHVDAATSYARNLTGVLSDQERAARLPKGRRSSLTARPQGLDIQWIGDLSPR